MLPEDKRTQLDGIVQQMVSNKESDSNISFVVDDFKKKYTPIEAPAVKPQTPILTNPQGGFGTALKDVTVGAGKSLMGSARGTAQMLQGAGQRAIALATPASLEQVRANTGFKSLDDTSQEGSQIAEQLKAKSRGEQVGKIIGTAGEIATGFMTTGGPQAVSKAKTALQTRQATKLADKSKSYTLDLVSPKATTDVSEQAIRQGRVSEPRLLKKAKILPSKRDQDLAKAVEGFVTPNKTVLQNTDSIDKGVREINRGVKEYVIQNKVPFNTNQLKSKLNSGKEELKVIFASDTNAERTYNAVVDEFMKHVSSGDTAGLLEARQTVDKIPAIKKLLDSQGLGENVKKEVVLTVREMANRYVAELLPSGNNFRASLLKESKMIRAIENIAEKNAGMIGKNNLQILAQRYPILKWVIGGVATGLAGSAGIGVGSAIIGSTD